QRTHAGLGAFFHEPVLAGLHGAVVLHRIDLERSGNEDTADAVVARAAVQAGRLLAETRACPVVVELSVLGEQGREGFLVAIHERGLEAALVHLRQFVEQLIGAGRDRQQPQGGQQACRDFHVTPPVSHERKRRAPGKGAPGHHTLRVAIAGLMRMARRAGPSTASWLMMSTPSITGGTNFQSSCGRLNCTPSHQLMPKASTMPRAMPMAAISSDSTRK